MRKSTVLGAAVGIVSACLIGGAPAGAVEADRGATSFAVSADVSNVEPMLGDRFRIRGEVGPARPGAVVKLQLRFKRSGKWTTTKTDVLNHKSRYRFVAEAKSVRYRQYRVVMPASGAVQRGASPGLGVTVYGWRRLTSLDPVGSVAMDEVSAVTLNAVEYPGSLLAHHSDEGSIDYNINRGCKLMEARYGIDDASETTATGTVELEADGISKYSKSFTLTQTQFVRHSVRGVFRIKFRWSSSNTEGTSDPYGARVAVGSPRVLCNF